MRTRIAFALFALVLTAGLHAQTISGLYNTGVDANGTPLPDGAPDPHWTETPIGGPPAWTGTFAATSAGGYPIDSTHWLGDDTVSDWIGNGASEQDAATGEFVYQETFTLTGDVSDFSLSGQFAADDVLDNILVNNNSTDIGGGGFQAWTPFDIGPGVWEDGTNTIDFIVKNDGGPSGLRVEFNQPVAAPDGPIGSLLVAAVFGAMLAVRRRSAQHG
jgi:hypothetical protein